jgi:hypothetical protein
MIPTADDCLQVTAHQLELVLTGSANNVNTIPITPIFGGLERVGINKKTRF